MGHLPQLISDLGLILILASIVSILFKWLKQPVVLGYIVAGLLASSHTHFVPSIVDLESVQIWSEIGVVFLLFALGLEFSFKKLMDVGGTASIAGGINMGAMIIIGYIVGILLGWSQMDSLFLGAMLSMSSTTIIIKAFNDMNLQKKKFAGIVFGMLIVEDLVAILMMVLLTTLAVTKNFEGVQLLMEIGKLIFFIAIWFVVGIFIIPTLLKNLKQFLNDETLLILSVGLCLGMVILASYVGFSAALGAFIMGSILAETIEAKHIERVVEPLKNFFGAIFFVSVGMMIDPNVIIEFFPIVILLSLIILIGRPIFATLGVLASGQSLRVSIYAGLSLAQIGEFSFIIATLGLSLGVISNTLYPIIVAVSVITTFTTPYFIKAASPISTKLEKLIPQKWNVLINGYTSSNYQTVSKENTWRVFIKDILIYGIIYLIIIVAIILVFNTYINPFIIRYISGIWGEILSSFITLLCLSPFIRSIIIHKIQSKEFKLLWKNNQTNRVALVLIVLLRIVLCFIVTMLVLKGLFSASFFIPALIISTAYIGIIVLFKWGKKQSTIIDTLFLNNYNSKQLHDEKNAYISTATAQSLLSKNIHVEEVVISPNSSGVGRTLKELNFRQNSGVNIITIIRGNQKINIPDGNAYLYPYDKVVIVGSDEEIQLFRQKMEDHSDYISYNEEQYHISLSHYPLEEGSPIIGKSILDLNMREKTECMIIGIDRNKQSIVQFDASFILNKGDILWIAGEVKQLKAFDENIKA